MLDHHGMLLTKMGMRNHSRMRLVWASKSPTLVTDVFCIVRFSMTKRTSSQKEVLVVRGSDPLDETGGKELFYDTVSLDILTLPTALLMLAILLYS